MIQFSKLLLYATQSYGVRAGSQQCSEAGDICAICQAEFRDPIALLCQVRTGKKCVCVFGGGVVEGGGWSVGCTPHTRATDEWRSSCSENKLSGRSLLPSVAESWKMRQISDGCGVKWCYSPLTHPAKHLVSLQSGEKFPAAVKLGSNWKFVKKTKNVFSSSAKKPCLCFVSRNSTCSARTACVCGSTGRERARCVALPSSRPPAAGRTAPPRLTSRSTELRLRTASQSPQASSCCGAVWTIFRYLDISYNLFIIAFVVVVVLSIFFIIWF